MISATAYDNYNGAFSFTLQFCTVQSMSADVTTTASRAAGT